MKMKDWRKLETYLSYALKTLEKANEEIDTSSDRSWNQDFNEVIEKLRCLNEEMIFTFGIKD